MARYICPSCGAAYNGKKCRSCLYENFTEEIAHGSHTHRGEPLVIDAPVRKPVKRKNPFGCEKRTRKQHPLAGLLVILALINTLLPLLRNWGLKLDAMKEGYIAAEPEPNAFLPTDALLLWEEGSIRIYADWEGREEDDFTVYVENDYNENLAVASLDVTVNGFAMESSGFYCNAYKNSTTRNRFSFDSTDLDHACIDRIQEVSFRLSVSDEDYTTLFITDTITLSLE